MVRALVQIEVHPFGVREGPVGPGIPDDDRPAMLVGSQTGVRHGVVLDPGHEPILSVTAALERQLTHRGRSAERGEREERQNAAQWDKTGEPVHLR
jgi:hypothetical protein